jgi:D-alanyl-D-alanine carboxypeptidase/D-alanyl-D-alanine-endopeptidase (penicillin-binding protein 4)
MTRKLVVCILVFFPSVLFSAPVETWPKIIEKEVSEAKLGKQDFGVAFFYQGKEIFTQNPTKKMIPASISKVFTSAAVLENIPPGSKLLTRFMSSGKIDGSTLKGDLYLVGGGDPGFVSESMWFLVNVLTRTGIVKVDGDLIIDDTYFDNKRFDDSRESIRVDRAYDAPVGAMSFNWNSINVFLNPGNKAGEKAVVYIDPENDSVELVNQLVTAEKTSYEVAKSFNSKIGKDVVTVRGKIALSSEEIPVYKGITDPIQWVGSNAKSFLKQRGINFSGLVKSGKVSADAKVLAKFESKPIEQLLTDMNKFSNNYVAEMLAKNLSAQKFGVGTMEKSIEIIRESLVNAGVDKAEFEIYNPSGFTRDNRFSPMAMAKVLESLRKNFKIFPEFLNSLPISGVDGTLRKRMKEEHVARWIRAKTGLLTGVHSLAGYMGLNNGEIITFVLMYNGDRDGGAVRNTFDHLLSEIMSKI